MSPVTVVWLRFAIGVVILGATVALRKQFRWLTRKELVYFIMLGFIGIFFPPMAAICRAGHQRCGYHRLDCLHHTDLHCSIRLVWFERKVGLAGLGRHHSSDVGNGTGGIRRESRQLNDRFFW